MVKTKIEWADSTWNPVTGCLHGCQYCYARRIAQRFDGKMDECNPFYNAPLHRLNEPAKKGMIMAAGEVRTKATPYPFGFEPTLHRYRLGMPERWPKKKTIFVCSMADLFGWWVPGEWIDEVMEAAQAADRHRYLFLTKNPTRYCQLHDAGELPKSRFLGEERRKFWYGTSVTGNRQTVWDGGLEYNTFVNIEPLLEELEVDEDSTVFGTLNWIIIGAETGNRKEKIIPKPEWIERITRAADNRGIPVFMKDSLIPIMGEDRMRREFPWEAETRQRDLSATCSQRGKSQKNSENRWKRRAEA